MENSEFLETLNNIENEKECEKSILIVEYRKTPQELLNRIDELSNWIVERNECDWCTLKDCIHLDNENINDFFQIILSHNILKLLTELYRVDNNRHSIEFFVRIINNTIRQNENPKHNFLKHFNNYGFQFVKKTSIRFNLTIEEKPKDEELKTEIIELPYLELKTQKDQIRLLYDLGVIDFLQNNYKSTLKNNNNQTAHLLAQILKLSKGSIQPTINALLNDDPSSKNYPKESNETKGIIDKLNSAEPK